MLIVRPEPVEERAAPSEAMERKAASGPTMTDVPTYSALY
jgi:hypothetical protein